MISGDNERTAKTIANQAGIDEVIAGVLPEGKSDAVKALMEKDTDIPKKICQAMGIEF